MTPLASRYSPAVDLYALGLVAWVCLTGGRTEKSSQRLPPASHEAMRSWLEERNGAKEVWGAPKVERNHHNANMHIYR